MYPNLILWLIISVFIGIVGFKMEINKNKKLGSNIVAAFLGVFPFAFLTHFLIWTDDGFVNPVAAVVGMVCGLIAVKLEDYVFLRV